MPSATTSACAPCLMRPARCSSAPGTRAELDQRRLGGLAISWARRPATGDLVMGPPERTGGGNNGRSNRDGGRISARDVGYVDGAVRYFMFGEPCPPRSWMAVAWVWRTCGPRWTWSGSQSVGAGRRLHHHAESDTGITVTRVAHVATRRTAMGWPTMPATAAKHAVAARGRSLRVNGW